MNTLKLWLSMKIKATKVKACYDCKVSPCRCPELPITVRFWYQSKRHSAYKIEQVRWIKDSGTLRLFIINGKAAIEDLAVIERGRREGEAGFDELLAEFDL